MTDQPKPKPEFRRCRNLTVNGRQCHQRAMRGKDFCVGHRHRHPVCPPKGGKVDMPLLEDISAIQLVASQVAHGLFTETIDPWRAGKILYACQVAAMTVPRPAPVKTEPVKDHGPVTESFKDLNGEILGPDEPWVGARGVFEPTWKWDKYLYEQECERLGKPKPESPADMPPGGWLTPDEQAQSREIYPDPWMMKIVERRVQEDQRGNLPPLRERKCSYDNPHCGGPVKKFTYHLVCDYCVREREAHQRIARGEDPSPALDPNARFDPPSKVERAPSAPAPGNDNLDLNASVAHSGAQTMKKHCHPERRPRSGRSRRTCVCAKRDSRSESEPALSERSESNGVEAPGFSPGKEAPKRKGASAPAHPKPCCQLRKQRQIPDSTPSRELTTAQGSTPQQTRLAKIKIARRSCRASLLPQASTFASAACKNQTRRRAAPELPCCRRLSAQVRSTAADPPPNPSPALH